MSDPSHTATPSRSQQRGLALATLVLVCSLASLAALALMPWTAAARAQESPTIGIDADPSGNTATSLDRIDPCAVRSIGETFDIDLFLQDVDQLLAWEIYIEYDAQILEVVNRQVDLFQAANEGSNVFDVSEKLPDSDGLYRIAAADTSDPPTPDSGSGVLARLTFRAKGTGISDIRLAFQDLDEDGNPDLGPFLRDIEAQPIGDIDDDTFFDGPLQNAQIAIDTECPATVNPSAGDDGAAGIATEIWVVIGATAAAAATLAGLGVKRLARRRRSA